MSALQQTGLCKQLKLLTWTHRGALRVWAFWSSAPLGLSASNTEGSGIRWKGISTESASWTECRTSWSRNELNPSCSTVSVYLRFPKVQWRHFHCWIDSVGFIWPLAALSLGGRKSAMLIQIACVWPMEKSIASQAFQRTVINTVWNYSVASSKQIKGQGRLGAALCSRQLMKRWGSGKRGNTTAAAHTTSAAGRRARTGGGGGLNQMRLGCGFPKPNKLFQAVCNSPHRWWVLQPFCLYSIQRGSVNLSRIESIPFPPL